MKSFSLIALLSIVLVPAWADPNSGAAPTSPDAMPAAEIVDRYVAAMQSQQSRPHAVSMEVDMDAKLPRLKKEGRLHAFRFITRLGQIFYRTPRFEGDNTIKKEVIGRYLQAEKEARSGAALAVTPANYKFKYKGVTDYAGLTAHVFQVSPKKKKLGMYKGELWIDSKTFLPLREWGVLSKNPSMFLKSVYFVRDYMIYDGVAVPRRLISDISTRLVGQAQLTVWYENVKIGDETPQTAVLNGPSDKSQADGGNF